MQLTDEQIKVIAAKHVSICSDYVRCASVEDVENAIYEALAAHSAKSHDAWKLAVDHELVTIGSTADSFASPKDAIQALIDWHVAVSLDPAVSTDAQALIARGRRESMTAAARTPDFAAVKDKRMSELTPDQRDDARELWIRNNVGWVGEYHRRKYTFLLKRLDAARAEIERSEREGEA